MKRTLLFSIIASVLTTGAFATSSTVTSKDYVDARDALKQNTIPVAGTNSSTPGSTIVTYTGTAGTIGERGICNDPTDNCNQADIATYGLVGNAVEYIENNMPTLPTGTANNVVTYDNNGDIGGERGIYDGSTTYDSSTDADKLVTASVVHDVANNLPTKTVTTRVCTSWIDGQSHTDANCLLWNLVDETVYGAECNVDADCAGYIGNCSCLNHMCNCMWY